MPAGMLALLLMPFGAEGLGGGFAADRAGAGPAFGDKIAGEFGGDIAEAEGDELLCGHDVAF